jgi:hypothetical protein
LKKGVSIIQDDLTQKLSILCATWNVGNAQPPEDLSPWLPREGFDLIAVGAQECGYDPRPGFGSCQDDWNDCLCSHFGEEYVNLVAFCITPQAREKLPEKDSFKLRGVLLKSQSLVDVVNLKLAEKQGLAELGEIRLSLFIRKSLRDQVSGISSSLQTCGRLDGLSGNKGGLSVSLRLGDTRLSFFNSHLNAHTENMVRRNEDTRQILQGLQSVEGFEPTNAHYSFFFGDLNYRLVMEHEDVLAGVEKADWENLLKTDQLKDQQGQGKFLANFREAPISFAPTFKVKRKVPLTYSDERVPSYCDRVLWKAYPGMPIRVLSYSSVESFTTSDHKPVHGGYEVEFLPLKGLPESSPAMSEVTLSDLKATGLTLLNPEEPANVQVVASLSTGSHPALQATQPSPELQWQDPLKLGASEVPLNLLKHAYILLGLRQVEEKQEQKVGEVAIPLAELLQEAGVFEVDLFQFGLPAGKLSGKICCVSAAQD